MVKNLLDRLQKVKKVGTDKWLACCPVHNDSNPSMSVAFKDNRILCYCFACQAKGAEVAEAVGLKVSDLFADSISGAAKIQYHRESLEKELDQDQMFVRIYEAWDKTGKPIKLSDRKRYKHAINRIAGIQDKLKEM